MLLSLPLLQTISHVLFMHTNMDLVSTKDTDRKSNSAFAILFLFNWCPNFCIFIKFVSRFAFPLAICQWLCYFDKLHLYQRLCQWSSKIILINLYLQNHCLQLVLLNCIVFKFVVFSGTASQFQCVNMLKTVKTL